MKLIAVTGSIGCGKTTLSNLIRKMGFCVFDADGWVRRLYYQKDFIKVIAQHFPSVMEQGKVNKRALRNIVFSDAQQRKLLESLIHPFLKLTLKNLKRKNAFFDDLFFLDVALLFEMGWEKYCDLVIVADVDYETQKKRVMKRDNISAEDFDKINNVQLNNEHKKALADVVINTNQPLNVLKTKLICLLSEIED